MPQNIGKLIFFVDFPKYQKGDSSEEMTLLLSSVSVPFAERSLIFFPGDKWLSTFLEMYESEHSHSICVIFKTFLATAVLILFGFLFCSFTFHFVN